MVLHLNLLYSKIYVKLILINTLFSIHCGKADVHTIGYLQHNMAGTE